jgi:hypothetical protein
MLSHITRAIIVGQNTPVGPRFYANRDIPYSTSDKPDTLDSAQENSLERWVAV